MSKLKVTLTSNDRNGIDDWLKSDDMVRLLKSFAPRLRSTLNQYAVLGDTISRNENWDKSRAEVIPSSSGLLYVSVEITGLIEL